MWKVANEHLTQTQMVNELIQKMGRIKISTNRKIYMSILAEIQEWTMSNPYIRERMWFKNG